MPTFLILLLAIAALVMAYYRKTKPALLTPLLLLALALALYGTVARSCTSVVRAERSAQTVFAEAMGIMLGHEVAQALPEGGVIALVRMPKVAWIGSASLYDMEVAGLRLVLDERKYPIHIVYPDDPPNDAPLPHEYLLSSEVADLLKKVPDAKAMVLQHAGFELEANVKSGQFPPTFILAGDASLADLLLGAGVARAAVDYKSDVDWAKLPTRKMSPEEIFALRYQIKRP